jgi:hypothetical protein
MAFSLNGAYNLSSESERPKKLQPHKIPLPALPVNDVKRIASARQIICVSVLGNDRLVEFSRGVWK